MWCVYGVCSVCSVYVWLRVVRVHVCGVLCVCGGVCQWCVVCGRSVWVHKAAI